MPARPTITDTSKPWPQRVAATSNGHAEHMRGRARELRAAMPLPEVLLWERLRRGQLCGLKFRRQHVLGPYVADFYCHELRLVVEVDGSQHTAMVEQDAARDAWMCKRGVRVLRVPASVVLHDVGVAVGVIEREAERITQEAAEAKKKRKKW